ncbi:MAG: TRAP transporter large permease subunit, partial [Deferribacteraceae bacterium]|nr:TRAP transporter large permease subunit [Deferribacteraceae bacterium]
MSDSQASTQTTWTKITDILILVIAAGMAFFHLYAASLGTFVPYLQTAVHWGFVGAYIIIVKPLKFPGGRIIDVLFILANIFFSYYQLVLQDKAIQMAGIYSNYEVVIAVCAVVLAMLIAWRVLGTILPVICIIFILYGLFGNELSGLFHTSRFSVNRLFTDIYANVSSGMYGQTLYVSAQFIFLFVLFGCILDITGAGTFFVDLAFAIAGRARGGPAQAAVFSSMLMGTINGSG